MREEDALLGIHQRGAQSGGVQWMGVVLCNSNINNNNNNNNIHIHINNSR